MSVLTEARMDAHGDVLDPAQFPYSADVAYHPAGQEMGNASYFLQLMACYQVKHALLVGPNSGYGTDNRCLLDALKLGQGAFKGIAVVPNDCDLESLQALKSQGVIGIAFNAALQGFDFYADIEPLPERRARRVPSRISGLAVLGAGSACGRQAFRFCQVLCRGLPLCRFAALCGSLGA